MRNTLRERLEYEGFSTEAAEDEEAASNMCENPVRRHPVGHRV